MADVEGAAEAPVPEQAEELAIDPVPNAPPTVQLTRAEAVRRQVEKEIQTWVKIVVDPGDSATLKTTISGGLPGIGKHKETSGSNRISVYDHLVDQEPSAAWSKSHDVFQRVPGLSKSKLSEVVNTFQSYCRDDADILIMTDGGWQNRSSSIYGQKREAVCLSKRA